MFKLSTYLTLQKLHKHISKCAVRCLHYKRYLMLAQLLQFQALPAEYLSRQEKHYICLVIQIFNPKIYLTAHSWTQKEGDENYFTLNNLYLVNCSNLSTIYLYLLSNKERHRFTKYKVCLDLQGGFTSNKCFHSQKVFSCVKYYTD